MHWLLYAACVDQSRKSVRKLPVSLLIFADDCTFSTGIARAACVCVALPK